MKILNDYDTLKYAYELMCRDNGCEISQRALSENLLDHFDETVLDACNSELEVMSTDDLETVCTGEQGVVVISQPLNDLLTWIFEELVC